MTKALLTGEMLDHAIAAHERWHIRLRCAIETGRSEFTADTISREDSCQLGLLLQDSGQYAAIRCIHAEFHKEVGRILSLALHSRRRDARQEFEGNTYFLRLSAALICEIRDLARRTSQASEISRPEMTCPRS